LSDCRTTAAGTELAKDAAQEGFVAHVVVLALHVGGKVIDVKAFDAMVNSLVDSGAALYDPFPRVIIVSHDLPHNSSSTKVNMKTTLDTLDESLANYVPARVSLRQAAVAVLVSAIHAAVAAVAAVCILPTPGPLLHG